jgi:hypothetical protein
VVTDKNVYFMFAMALEINAQMTSSLRVPLFKEVAGDAPMERLSALLDKEAKHPLAFAPWKAYPYHPQVGYAIAHNNDYIFLKYYVAERFVAAAHGATNAPVYEDSCVEFFISFDEKGYYNLEFNSLGVWLAAFGTARDSRSFLAEERIRKIRSQTVLTREGGGDAVHWTITLAIPREVFQFHALPSLGGVQGRANFYKCGDCLPEPHYLAWSEIESPEPDFHLPQFFGTVVFE